MKKVCFFWFFLRMYECISMYLSENVRCKASRFLRFTTMEVIPKTHWIGVMVGSRSGLNFSKKRRYELSKLSKQE